MNRRFLIGLLILGAATAFASEELATDFARYSVILDRKPFGLPPAPAAAEGGPATPQDSFATYVRLTAMMQEEGGVIRVGFVDKKQKDKVYMLTVGEKADDYDVLEADLTSELAKIRKGQEEQWLSMKVPGAVAPPVGHTKAEPSVAKPVQVADIRPAPAPPSGILAGLRRQSRYAAIRRAEIESEKKAEDAKRLGVFREPPAGNKDEDEEDVTSGNAGQVSQVDETDADDTDDEGEEIVLPNPAESDDEEDDEDTDEDEVIREAEIQAHLQNYQKELIRQGLPPLPIPLTAKTDDELVKEGTLAPLPAGTDTDDDDDE
jgi:hypothetical protein